jgi:Anti-sigma-K factor rskA
MNIDHEPIDELLAGYVLQGLSGEDAAEADRLLTEHVPDCEQCRETLDMFRAVGGDLAMALTPMTPPETLLPRIERSLGDRRGRRAPAWHPARLVGAAAAVIVLIGMAGLVVTQSAGDHGSGVLARADLTQIQTVRDRPDARTTDVGEVDEVTAPGLEEAFLVGTGVSAPPPGTTYRLWTIGSTGTAYLGDFVPTDGVIALRFPLDPTVERLLVTIEPIGSEPGTPGQPAWPAAG